MAFARPLVLFFAVLVTACSAAGGAPGHHDGAGADLGAEGGAAAVVHRGSGGSVPDAGATAGRGGASGAGFAGSSGGGNAGVGGVGGVGGSGQAGAAGQGAAGQGTGNTAGADPAGDAPTPGTVACAWKSCDLEAGEICCAETVLHHECARVGCLFGWAVIECDGPEDCAAGRSCCSELTDVRYPAICRPECLNNDVHLCHTDDDCPGDSPHCCSYPGRRSCSATPCP